MEMYSGSCALIGMVRVIGIEIEEGGGVGTKRRSYKDGQCCVKKSFSAPMLPRNERD